MKKNGKMKRLLCLIAVFCMMLQSFSIVNAAADDITINAVSAANGVSLSWNASDFGNAAEYTLYRDGVPFATVNAENTNATFSDGTWTYNDVYFNTLEQKLRELPGKDSADLNIDHTYYVKAGNVTSADATGKPDSTKLVYITFSGVTDTANWNGVNKNQNGITLNKYASIQATRNDNAIPLNTTNDYASYTSKYSIESLTTITHRGFSFFGELDGKMAGGLVAAKTGDSTVPYASAMQFNIPASGYDYFYSDTENRNYTAWVNASIVDNKMITNSNFGGLMSTGEVIPDNEEAVISCRWANDSSFAFDIDDSLSEEDRYATYKFTVNRQFNSNSSNKYLNFYAASSSDSKKGVRTSDAACYDADGEQAAIHSIALMRTDDCLSGSVEDVLMLDVLPYEIEGVKVTKDGSTSNNLVSGGTITGISVTRYTEAADPVTVILALYESGKLVETKIGTVTPAMAQYASGDLTLTTGSLTLPTLTTNHTARIFLLKNTSTLVPVAESYPVPVQSLY